MSQDTFQVQHGTTPKGGAFFIESNGTRLAEMVYVMSGPKTMIIEHTEVSPDLKGQQIGKKLLGELVSFVRKEQIKVIPLCPFANAMLKRITEWQDILR